MSEERIKKLARSFAQAWLRPDDPDTATPTLVETLSTTMLAFYAAARPPSGGAAPGLAGEIDALLTRTADLAQIISTTDHLPADPETEPFGSALRREFLALRQGVFSLLACHVVTPPRRTWTRCVDCDGDGHLGKGPDGRLFACDKCGGHEDALGVGWVSNDEPWAPAPPAPTEAPAPDLEALRDKAAARSAAEFANRLGQRTRHAEAVADCAGCNLTFLATWVLDLLGPEPEKSRAPGPPDPPKQRDNTAVYDHAAVRDAALRRGGPEGVK